MHHSQPSLQERRAASLSISTSPLISVLSPSPLALSETRSAFSGLSAPSRKFLWAPLAADAKAPLPSPMLKAERESRNSPSRRWLESVCSKPYAWICVLLAILFIIHQHNTLIRLLPVQEHFVSSVKLPVSAGPVSFNDAHGRLRWTMYIPESSSFPLSTTQYRAMYDASRQLGSQLAGPHSRTAMPSRLRNSFTRYALDDSFMDVDEAQRIGALPRPKIAADSESDNTANLSICHSSLTFVMGPGDVGFGKTLLSLWLAYGSARQEGRHFFIEDSLWPYGRYTDFFMPVHPADCVRPSTSHILPFPHTARHLVVSPSTWSWTLGAKTTRRFDLRKSGREHERTLFALARRGQQETFRLNEQDQKIVDQRISQLRKQAIEAGNAPLVGVHIRRGDMHPLDWMYSRDYLPYERYADAAAEIIQRSHHQTSEVRSRVPVLLASDDPDTIVQPDFLGPLEENGYDVQNAQSHIVLASQRSLQRAEPIYDQGFIKHVDENSGWEGGFFASLFNGLGKAPTGESTVDDRMVAQDQGITDLKRLVGRSYLLDLAVTSQADAVVCAVSSATCRALGVMLGWDKVTHGRWVNVDDGRSWTFDLS